MMSSVKGNCLVFIQNVLTHAWGPKTLLFFGHKALPPKKRSYGQIRFPSLLFQYFLDTIRVLYSQIQATKANDRNRPNMPFDRKKKSGVSGLQVDTAVDGHRVDCMDSQRLRTSSC